jgi:hypothetical protein
MRRICFWEENTMTNKPVPKWLIAAWERLYIIGEPGSAPDRSVNVRNIQTPTLFGDCRIPKDRPAFQNAKSLSDLTDKELTTLYNQQGFSGFTTVDGYITTWHHEIDYQPPDGSIDIGRIELSGGSNMFEHGVQSTYTEHWWNLASGDGKYFGVTVLRTQPDGTYRNHEILSVNGDHFVYARNRPKDLPMADSLETLIKKTKASREQILEYLDCEISHGFVLGGTKPWEIQLSTLPYKTGQSLDFVKQIHVDPKTGDLSQRDADPGDVWSFEVNTMNIEDLLVLFPA